MITLISWGRNHGPAPDADANVDATNFTDPPPAIRQLDGRHPDIQQIVLGQDPVAVDLIHMAGDFAVALTQQLDRVPVVAIGCNHGYHRSVAAVEVLAAYLDAVGVVVDVFHRDLGEGQ